MDLLIEFSGERFAFELKLNSSRALNEGRVQLTEYLNRLGLDFGRLLIFNRTPPKDWSALGQRESFKENDKTIEVIWL